MFTPVLLLPPRRTYQSQWYVVGQVYILWYSIQVSNQIKKIVVTLFYTLRDNGSYRV